MILKRVNHNSNVEFENQNDGRKIGDVHRTRLQLFQGFVVNDCDAVECDKKVQSDNLLRIKLKVALMK